MKVGAVSVMMFREAISVEERMKADLSRYRISRAEEMLSTARREWKAGDYYTANNRAYYCVFHAIRAILALDGEDYRKHSAVIAKFDEKYVKTGLFAPDFSKIVHHASRLRNKSDHEDYYVCTPAETAELIENAARFLQAVRFYLESQRGVS
mgnify:CR=1 FL=1